MIARSSQMETARTRDPYRPVYPTTPLPDLIRNLILTLYLELRLQLQMSPILTAPQPTHPDRVHAICLQMVKGQNSQEKAVAPLKKEPVLDGTSQTSCLIETDECQ